MYIYYKVFFITGTPIRGASSHLDNIYIYIYIYVPIILWEYIMNMLSLIEKRVLTLMMYTTIILKTLTS